MVWFVRPFWYGSLVVVWFEGKKSRFKLCRESLILSARASLVMLVVDGHTFTTFPVKWKIKDTGGAGTLTDEQIIELRAYYHAQPMLKSQRTVLEGTGKFWYRYFTGREPLEISRLRAY